MHRTNSSLGAGKQGVRGGGKYIVAAAESGEYYKVIFTKDTHTADYLHTQEGKRLPVLHGQEGTEGYKIHPDIMKRYRSIMRRNRSLR